MDKLNLIDFSKYTITRDGKIFSNWGKHYMLGSPDRNGYLTICMRTKDKKSMVYLFHRVIWFYFNGEIPEGLEINHKDEDKSNNSLDNLELLTRPENIRYGTRAKRAAESNHIAQKGKQLSKEHLSNLRKASAKRRMPVLQYNLETNEPIKEWCSLRDIQRTLNFESIHISHCCKGGFYRKGKWVSINQAYGYGWKYI